MSRFSGKCDFCDHIYMHNDEKSAEEELKKTRIYIYGKDGRRHLLKIDTIKDAVKYYPYIIAIAAWNSDRATIELSSRSFIDQEEAEHLGWDIDNVLKYWRRCKRSKIPFDEQECYDKVNFWADREDKPLREIISRVAKDGDKAKFDKIHRPLWEHYRKDWFEEMVAQGYSEYEAFSWCFNEWFPSRETIKKRLGRDLKWEREEK